MSIRKELPNCREFYWNIEAFLFRYQFILGVFNVLGEMVVFKRRRDGFGGGKVIDALISQIDLFPTLCEVTGLTLPEDLERVSLLPLLRGAQSVRDAVFSEVNWQLAPNEGGTCQPVYAYSPSGQWPPAKPIICNP